MFRDRADVLGREAVVGEGSGGESVALEGSVDALSASLFLTALGCTGEGRTGSRTLPCEAARKAVPESERCGTAGWASTPPSEAASTTSASTITWADLADEVEDFAAARGGGDGSFFTWMVGTSSTPTVASSCGADTGGDASPSTPSGSAILFFLWCKV